MGTWSIARCRWTCIHRHSSGKSRVAQAGCRPVRRAPILRRAGSHRRLSSIRSKEPILSKQSTGQAETPVLSRDALDTKFRAQIRHAHGVTLVSNREGDGVLHPVVPNAVGIVRSGGERVLLRAQVAAESEVETQRVAWRAGTELQPFQFGVGAVDVQADACADQDANDRLGHALGESYRYADREHLAAAQPAGQLAVFTHGFDGQNLRAPIAQAQAGRKPRLNALSPGANALRDVTAVGVEGFSGIAASDQPALFQPPDLVR